MGSNKYSNITLPPHGLKKARGVHKLVRNIAIFIVFRILDFTGNLMLDAHALILIILTFLGEHGLPHIEGQVVDCEIDVHDGMQFLLGGDEIEGGIVELSKLQISDTGQLVSCFCQLLSSSGGLILCLTLERRLGNVG